jgi:hypothetical protein
MGWLQLPQRIGDPFDSVCGSRLLQYFQHGRDHGIASGKINIVLRESG